MSGGEQAIGSRRLVVTADGEGERLDRYLAAALDGVSRSFAQELIRAGRVRVNGATPKPAHRLASGDRIEVELPPPPPSQPVPEPIPLAIVYEDEALLVVNKPRGMTVHPAPGNRTGTLVNALLHHVGVLPAMRRHRPGIVHRLDKGTTGLLVVAKTERAMAGLVAQIRVRAMERRYLALVDGEPSVVRGRVEAPIGRDPRDRKRMAMVREGRPAITHFRLLGRQGGRALLEARLATGRTHQIRVHLAGIGLPVTGDPVYNRTGRDRLGLAAQGLHAVRLAFRHPVDERPLSFQAPPPDDLRAAIARAGLEEALDAYLAAFRPDDEEGEG